MSPRRELELLLEEDPAAAKARSQRAFDESAAPLGGSLVLFGAGGLGRKTLAGLRRAGVEPLAFADNNSALWGKTVEGLQVLSPGEAAGRFGQTATFVLTIWGGELRDTMAERMRPLLELGCRRVLNFGLLFWKYPEIFLPYYALNLPHLLLEQKGDVLAAFDLWQDDASRNEYVCQVRWRLLLDFAGLPSPVQHAAYFPYDLAAPAPDEVFIDCGAFDGDTLRSFLGLRGESFRQAVAFEADPANFAKLRDYISRLSPDVRRKITAHPFAVGARRGKVRFDATGTGASVMGRGSLEVDCVPLDEILAGCEPTWIKMDIEAAEPGALQGARGLIAKGAPVLAICAYHEQDHLWRIPLQIRALSPDYRFFLRPHAFETFDLVCYAIPAARCLSPL